jgi:hypothetical protein
VARPEKQALDLTLCVIRLFHPVGRNILLNHAVGALLTGLDMNAQHSG